MTFNKALEQLMIGVQHNKRTHAVRYDCNGEVWVSVTIRLSKLRSILNIITNDLHPGHDAIDCQFDSMAVTDCLADDWEVVAIG